VRRARALPWATEWGPNGAVINVTQHRESAPDRQKRPVPQRPVQGTVPWTCPEGTCQNNAVARERTVALVHVVVNHLHLREPVTDATVQVAREGVQRVVDAGGLAAHLAKVDDTHLILVLMFALAEDAARISREVGGPWMREHIVPLLARDTERSVGEVIASARA
jgi:hypothetical protein